MEHCTLDYDLMDLWEKWDFAGDLTLGVIDQRSDDIGDEETVWRRTQPALEHFSADRLLLTSECGFGHVPIEITRAKLKVLAQSCHSFRARP